MLISFFHFPRFSYFTISSFFPFSLLLKSISGNKIQYINYKNKQYNLWQGLKLLFSWKSPNHPIKLGRCKNKVSITIKQLNTNFYTNLLNRTIGNHIWIFRNEIYQESIMLVDQYSSKNNDLYAKSEVSESPWSETEICIYIIHVNIYIHIYI